MSSAFFVLGWCVLLADRVVFGQKILTKTQVDLRTLACFLVWLVAFLFGLGLVGFLQSNMAIIIVWIFTSLPLACVFVARHQRNRPRV